MDEVEIVDYDARWPGMFSEEAGILRALLDPVLLVGVEHFGSTAIPGLAAKPIIDILVAVRSLPEARAKVIEPLERIGYVFWAENPKTDRMFLVRGMPPYGERRTHHIHICEPTAEPWLEGLPFRDHLRTHPEEAQRYGRLKRELAIRHRMDREAYTDAKASYVEEILAKARVNERGGSGVTR
jgi:GrpB-like predicted nucleotidyltransferase (UPF0157 family)